MKRLIIALSLVCAMHVQADSTIIPQELLVSESDKTGVKFFVPEECANFSSDHCITSDELKDLETKIDILIQDLCCGCAAKPITQADFFNEEYIITVPGVYCLAADVTGTIFIESDNVILDLNGHTIFLGSGQTNIEVSGHSNVVIKNGLVSHNKPPLFSIKAPSTFSGILVDQQSHAVRIEKITAENASLAILLDTVFDVSIAHCICTNNIVGLVVQNGCQDIDVRNCQFDSNNGNGVEIDTSSAVRLQECTANHNQESGFFSVTSACVQFIQCVADANGNDGFNLRGIPAVAQSTMIKANPLTMHGSGLVLSNCSACFNDNDGFECVHDSNICFENCFASGNLKGFSCADNCLGIIRACTATNNRLSLRRAASEEMRAAGGVGFADDGTNAMEYYSNYACDNDINYSTKITSASISGPSFADGVDNIDCALSDLEDCDSSSSSDELPPCAPRPIYRQDFIDTCPTSGGGMAPLMKGCARFTGCLIITESGHYCLAEDVTGAITIQASGVTLDMNGYTLFQLPGLNGITITNPNLTQPLIDVRIHNGLLAGVGGGTGRAIRASNTAIVIDGSEGIVEAIRLENLTISTWNFGIFVSGIDNNPPLQFVNQLTIKNVHVRDCTRDGITLILCNDVLMQGTLSINNLNGLSIADCQKVLVEHSGFDFNGDDVSAGNGVSINTRSLTVSLGINFRDCHANNNSFDGYLLNPDVSLAGVTFTRCSADSNQVFGFAVLSSNCITLDTCTARDNTNGFEIESSNDICLKNCVACDNNRQVSIGQNGFQVLNSAAVLENCVAKGHRLASSLTGNGFFISGNGNPGSIIVRGCTASDNEVGFFDDIFVPSKYYSNVSCGNMTNYVGVIDAPVTSAAAAQAFENVDCNLSGPSIANATLSVVEIIASIVADIDADTDATLSIVEDLSSRIENLNCLCPLSLLERIESIVEDISVVTDATHSIAEHISTTTDDIAVIEIESASRLDIIESVVEHLSSLVETITFEPGPCAPTMIVAQTTITMPGNYCLANDIAATGLGIEIGASNVTLDLNGHTITVVAGINNHAITIDDTFSNITIKHGLVVGGDTTSEGIFIGVTAGNQDILIEDITIQNCGIGIDAFGTTDLAINNVIVSNPSTNTAGVALNMITNAHVKNSQFEGSDNGIVIISSSNVRLENCSTNNAGANGTLIDGSTCVEIIDCSAQGNAEDGFACGACTDVLFKNCYACNNDTAPGGFAGFSIESTNTDAYLLNCVAENNNNTDGYGFFIDTASGTLVQGCTATNNETGFRDFAAGANRFYSNVACYNTINYAPAAGFGYIAAVAASSAVAGAFQNLACN